MARDIISAMWQLRAIAAAAAATAVLFGCTVDESAPPSAATTHRLVDPDQFAAALAEPDRVAVNVHIPFEGDIPGTDVSVPYNSIPAEVDRLPPPGTPLAIYCRSGSMSADAVPILQELGYRDIVELRGGMLAWTEAGRRLSPDPLT